jgi:Zinc carboxypeptidase/Cytosolic carboxypeptidase N-terminal domain
MLIVIAPRGATAAITLDADFESGSLCLTPSSACDDNGAASSVNGNMVTLVGRDNFNSGSWKWIYFRADGVNGQQVTFEIGDDFATGGSSLNNHRMMYSYDQENWHFFDDNERSAPLNKFTFENNSPFTQNSVYVAYGPPYPYQRTVDHTSSIAASPYVLPTTSGNGTLVIGQSPGSVDDLGRTITPKDLYGFIVTDPEQTGPKKKIVALGGVHSNETLGNFTLEGLIDFLVSDELEAAHLRRYAEFYIYPMANPEGRYAGYNRSTVQRPTVDPNRAWNPPNYNDPDNITAPLTDIRTVGEAMKDDTGEDIDYMIDFHSTVNPAIPYHYGLVLPEWQSDPFWEALQDLEPELLTDDAALIDHTGAKFGRDELNAEFSATFETVFPANEDIPRYLSMGRNFGLAWHETFFVPADLNFDGNLDILDWSLFIAGAETNMAALSAIDRYTLGDLDGDGQNSIQDFLLFKQLFDDAHGEGALLEALAHVPEPACAWLFFSACCLSGLRRAARSTGPFP